MDSGVGPGQYFIDLPSNGSGDQRSSDLLDIVDEETLIISVCQHLYKMYTFEREKTVTLTDHELPSGN